MYRLAVLLLVASVVPAMAHPGHADQSLYAGFTHPLTGIDHVMAMLCVGAWSALVGGSRMWAWPLAFVAATIGGGLLGYAGVAMPLVEQGIAASLVVIGMLLALAIKAPTAVGLAVVAAFAIFHGHAHGAEVGQASFVPYLAGFTIATSALHVAGIGIANGLMRMFNAIPVRLIGAATAVAGVALFAK
jgi:urease accessory protein